ncbi:DUF4190 domain-containing protein [Flavobacterium sp. NST-5]|uniref:DUF4190 domain-containing protein n=1 Tax=Flavobacterium ichthyis TaxID=2698827 RepID=A0ABW9Z8X1_9FLAO|nr:CCC motif membrane protein [Flavobacterium ichthyis]NBL64249.1 DUF4190 domain-containing protein [Flavobacterium ichthyis]
MEHQNFQENESLTNQKLPNATPSLVLGIISIVLCWCYGLIGLILSIIGLVLANKDRKLYSANPTHYTNYSTSNTGRILNIIGLILNILSIIYFIFIIAYIGFDALQDPELLQERVREMQGM